MASNYIECRLQQLDCQPLVTPPDLVVNKEVDVFRMRARIDPFVGIDPSVPLYACVAVDGAKHVVHPLRENEINAKSRIFHQTGCKHWVVKHGRPQYRRIW